MSGAWSTCRGCNEDAAGRIGHEHDPELHPEAAVVVERLTHDFGVVRALDSVRSRCGEDAWPVLGDGDGVLGVCGSAAVVRA